MRLLVADMYDLTSKDRLILLQWPWDLELIRIQGWSWILLDSIGTDSGHTPISDLWERALASVPAEFSFSIVHTHPFVEHVGRVPIHSLPSWARKAKQMPGFPTTQTVIDRIGYSEDVILYHVPRILHEWYSERIAGVGHALSTLCRMIRVDGSQWDTWLWYKVGTQFFSIWIPSKSKPLRWRNHYIPSVEDLAYFAAKDLYEWPPELSEARVLLTGDWLTEEVEWVDKLLLQWHIVQYDRSSDPRDYIRKSTILCV